MLEERSKGDQAEQLERFLAFSTPADQAPAELQADLRLAGNLLRMNLSAESQIQEPLRMRLAQKIQRTRPGKRVPLPRYPHAPIWLGVGIAALVILFITGNLLAFSSQGRLSGWRAAQQTRLAPTQVLTRAGNTPTNTRTVGLPLHLPVQTQFQSPTPGTTQVTPNLPLAVPTPGAKLQP